MAMKGSKHLNSIAQDEHDAVEYRKRVTLRVDGDTVAYEDVNFQQADSPLVLDVLTDLGRVGHDGYFLNDGTGNILIEISGDGVTYGGSNTLRWGEQLILANLNVGKIRLTWQEDSSFRAMVA